MRRFLRALNLRCGWGYEKRITEARLTEVSLTPQGLACGWRGVRYEEIKGPLLRLWERIRAR